MLVARLVSEDGASATKLSGRLLVHDIQNEMLGLEPLELLLADPTISDILVNRSPPSLRQNAAASSRGPTCGLPTTST